MNEKLEFEKEDRRYLLWLNHHRTIGPRTTRKLLTLFDSAGELFRAGETVLQQLMEEKVINEEQLREILTDQSEEWLNWYEERLWKKNASFVTLADEEYPKRLRVIFDPPAALFYKGDLKLAEEEHTLGVVGSRTPSIYGRQMTEYFVRKLASKNIVIVSGLAQGIDGDAHYYAMEMRGKTIGVIGGGIDTTYPQSNYRLYDEMERSQLILSEYGPGIAPVSFQFPLRNRIISGLSDGILVIEARRKSGTLITVDSALDQNKAVYAIPGRLSDRLSEGTNNLIRQGALLVNSPEEIMNELIGGEDLLVKNKRYEDLSGKEIRMLEEISLDPITPDELMEKTEGSLSEVISALVVLEQKGYIRQIERGCFVKGMRMDV